IQSGESIRPRHCLSGFIRNQLLSSSERHGAVADSSDFPILKTSFRLNFAQIGIITLAYQVTASLLQPVVGAYTDRRPRPYSLPVGMCVSLAGLLLLS